MGTQVLYKGTIRVIVAGESRLRVSAHKGATFFSFTGFYFVMKLEERIRIEWIPDEILVRSVNFGYFRIGDKVILQGQIVKEDLKKWGRPTYLIQADHYHNESIQSGA